MGDISSKEYENSLVELVKHSQLIVFREEIGSLKAGVLVEKGRIAPLTPFLDENRVLRVGGRLKNSLFNRDKKTSDNHKRKSNIYTTAFRMHACEVVIRGVFTIIGINTRTILATRRMKLG